MAFSGGTPSKLATGSRNLSTLGSDLATDAAVASSSIVSALYEATDTAGELTVVTEVRGERLHPTAVTITRIDLSDPRVATWSGVHTGGDGHYLSLGTREDELRYVGADHVAVLEHWADTLGAPS